MFLQQGKKFFLSCIIRYDNFICGIEEGMEWFIILNSIHVFFFKAQKVISLCGWEPRLLPYIVDCKDVKKDESIKSGHKHNNTQNSSITVYSSNLDPNPNNDPSTIEQYDHTSIVLVCRLCGAKVGLWAFRTTPQPPEFFRLIGQELNEDSNSENKQLNVEQ